MTFNPNDPTTARAMAGFQAWLDKRSTRLGIAQMGWMNATLDLMDEYNAALEERVTMAKASVAALRGAGEIAQPYLEEHPGRTVDDALTIMVGQGETEQAEEAIDLLNLSDSMYRRSRG